MNTPTIAFEDNHLLIACKPAGMPVQGDASGDPCLVDWAKGYLKAKYQKPGEVFCGLVHRLDRPVSGLVVLAKTSKALTRMNEIFRDRKVEKIYLALVETQPAHTTETLTDYLIKDSATNTSRRVSPAHKRADKCVLSYTLLAQKQQGWLLEVRPETGRHHQIRVQLSTHGTPIVGDLKYGARTKYLPHAIMLHAHRLVFEHPVKKEKMEVEVAAEWG